MGSDPVFRFVAVKVRFFRYVFPTELAGDLSADVRDRVLVEQRPTARAGVGYLLAKPEES